MQVELPGCSTSTINCTRKVYTIQDIDRLVKPIQSSKQISFPRGRMFCSYKDTIEIDWVKSAILDALNHPEKFDSPGDTFGATMKLQEMIKGNKCHILKKWYDIPQKLEYRNAYEVNAIVDANHQDRLIIPLTAEEILDVIVDINKNRSLEDICNVYNFHHSEMNVHYLELFKELYYKNELDKLIRFICTKSNDLGGFMDHGVGVVRNRLTSHYLVLKR